MEEGLTRKLAVIVHADVVGSTSLVKHNETLAHERIQDTFRRFSRTIASHGGIAHEIRGDALVAGFTKASDAVSASLDFQIANTAYNEKLSDELRPVLRVGIAMGEVVVADNTVTGDGVVLAQRLEQLAIPGGVCIQGAAYETVPKRLPFDYENIGERELKGFEEPVRVYAVRPKVAVGEDEQQTVETASAPDLPDKSSIAVLPFDNMSGDPEQEYFSDGITEDIITDLSRFRLLSVAARNSSFAYKGANPNIQDVATELHVDYVLEGSVRRAGQRVRVTAQLLESSTGNHLWAERYDRSFDDIFDVQDELTRTIVANLSRRIETDALERARRKLPNNMDAYDCVLRGRAKLDRRDREGTADARAYFEKALEMDPEYALAWTGLAGALSWEWNGAWSPSPEESFRASLEAAQKAFSLDPNDPRIVARLGTMQLLFGNLEHALQLCRRALDLNPNDSEALCQVALVLTYMGRHTEAIEHLEQAKALDPFGYSLIEAVLGIAYFCDQQYTKAIECIRSCRAGLAEVQAWLAAAYAQGEQLDEAVNQGERYLQAVREEMQENQAQIPESWCQFLAERNPFQQQADMDRFMEGLRKAGLN